MELVYLSLYTQNYPHLDSIHGHAYFSLIFSMLLLRADILLTRLEEITIGLNTEH